MEEQSRVAVNNTNITFTFLANCTICRLPEKIAVQTLQEQNRTLIKNKQYQCNILKTSKSFRHSTLDLINISPFS